MPLDEEALSREDDIFDFDWLEKHGDYPPADSSESSSCQPDGVPRVRNNALKHFCVKSRCKGRVPDILGFSIGRHELCSNSYEAGIVLCSAFAGNYPFVGEHGCLFQALFIMGCVLSLFLMVACSRPCSSWVVCFLCFYRSEIVLHCWKEMPDLDSSCGR